jgi:lysozyme
MKKLLFVIFLFLALFNISSTPDYNKKEKIQTDTFIVENCADTIVVDNNVYDYDSLYAEVLQSIRDFEGLKLTSYLCPANQKTIGYGHFVKDTDNLGDTITLAKAEQLLREDFDRCISAVNEYLIGDTIENKDVKVLALAHFTYNVGKGNLKNSHLLQLVKSGQPIDDELLKWIHYRDKDGNLVESKYIKQMRQYEVDLIRNVS